jgi:hypothetical protein
MVSLIVFLKNKCYLLKVLLKRTRGLLYKEKNLFGISAFGVLIFVSWSFVLCFGNSLWLVEKC